ncbi:hypothetical protein [Vibrio comitans]|uniref:30S ribosomal protein S6 modification protein n=1 Tax=Vibrio comitans NBRC 102076 TaxID=1219078 RepID=A0A4Y3IKQ3_9VIBR|nr:hypothetical protein [Vibrio comitans]GEA59927.1 hypothetical protein VCO01S_11200 [Vibrio comitans NBRC 102076]
MQNQSRIEIWYKVGTDQVLLGEVDHSDQINLLAMWRSVSILNRANINNRVQQTANYRLKLFDDDGHLMGSKDVSENDAETVLGNNHWMVRQSRNRFNNSEAPYTWVPVVAG